MSALEQAQRGTNDRLDETNARLDRTNARLDQAVEVLTRLVRVVAVQNSRVNQNFSRLTAPAAERHDDLPRRVSLRRGSGCERAALLLAP